MIWETVWARYRANWQTSAQQGIGACLLGPAASLVLGLLAMLTMGTSIFTVLFDLLRHHTIPNDLLFHLAQGLLLFAPLSIVVGLFGFGLTASGLFGTTVALRHGEPAGLAAFWRHAREYFVHLVVLALLVSLTLFAGFVLLLLLFLPLQLTALTVLWGPVLAIATALLGANLSIYPAYLIIADHRPVWDAYRQGWRIIGRRPGEALLSAALLVGFALTMTVTGLVNVLPIIGQAAYAAVLILAAPLATQYYAERFEQLLRPHL